MVGRLAHWGCLVRVPFCGCQVLYHDGEEEFLQLRNERVIWRMGPSEASEDGEDDIMMDDVNLDSDDSIAIMEAEETDDATDDDTPGSKKKGGMKRIRRKLRTRKSRVGDTRSPGGRGLGGGIKGTVLLLQA